MTRLVGSVERFYDEGAVHYALEPLDRRRVMVELVVAVTADLA